MTDTEDITRALPHAIGPEKSVLSSILQDPEEFLPEAQSAGITSSQFYHPAHQAIFEAATSLHEAGKPIELVSFVQHLLDTGNLDRVGGPSAVSDIYTYAPSPGHFHHHINQIRGKFTLRSMIEAANRIIANAYESPDAPAEALDAAEAAILAIRDQDATTDPKGLTEAISAIADEITDLIHGRKRTLGIETGFPDLDRMTSGLKPGEMFVIAARPSVGKSALMMNIVEHIAITEAMPAMVFSCEMTTIQVVKRSMGGLARFSWQSLEQGHTPNKGDLQRIKRAAATIAESRLIIDDTPGITITSLRAKARRAHRRHGIRIVAIDYLQLLRSTSRQAQGSREREIAEISAGIKALAKELSIPVIVLAQINRESEKRTGKAKGKPRMSDLRESGAIEQDADIIGLLSRQAYSADTEEEKEAAGGASTLEIAKNRTGPTGIVHLTFIPELVRFESSAPPVNDYQTKPRHPDF